MGWLFWKSNDHLKPSDISEYVDGRLSDEDTHEVEDHLKVCLVCREEVESLRITVALVRRLPQFEPRRSFVFFAPPVAKAASTKRNKVPVWASGLVATACALAFAVLLSVDLSGVMLSRPESFDQQPAASPAVEEGRPEYLTPNVPPEPTPAPGIGLAPPKVGAAEDDSSEDGKRGTGSAGESLFGETTSESGKDDDQVFVLERREGGEDTWSGWRIGEIALGATALVGGIVFILCRRIFSTTT
jgi:hypothetical protein